MKVKVDPRKMKAKVRPRKMKAKVNLKKLTAKVILRNLQEKVNTRKLNLQTLIYPISCVDLALPEFGFTSTLFFQTSPWESLRVANDTLTRSMLCK